MVVFVLHKFKSCWAPSIQPFLRPSLVAYHSLQHVQLLSFQRHRSCKTWTITDCKTILKFSCIVILVIIRICWLKINQLICKHCNVQTWMYKLWILYYRITITRQNSICAYINKNDTHMSSNLQLYIYWKSNTTKSYSKLFLI